jgi:hypothetical protein
MNFNETPLSTQRNMRNYAAGAALTFGVVLLVYEIVNMVFGGFTPEEIQAYESLLLIFFVGLHLVAGFLGSYLVARRVTEEHFQVGVITVILGYVFESIYFLVFGSRFIGDIMVVGSLVAGGAFGAYYAKSWREKNGLEVKIAPKYRPSTPKPEEPKQEPAAKPEAEKPQEEKKE